jgi:ribonuclease J|tara:strand:- start:2579 stop:3916 length:1338 start_codon:yes stop_codon:yes gene_type:complete
MTIEIFAVGGYEEVGQNMTAVKVDDQVVIMDMGIALDKLLLWGESTDALEEPELQRMGVLPDDSVLDKYRNNVTAIIASHAHLDHIGAMGKLAKKYNAPIVGTPFTLGILKENLREEKQKPTKFVEMQFGEVMELGDLAIEFLHVTHSTPQTTFTALHTSEGIVFYANDYKFDNYQALEKPPDYKRIEKLGREGVKAMIVESVRADDPSKTPSELVAKQMLNDTITETLNDNNGILVTCFSSHIERLNSILEVGKKLGRQIVFCGSSMSKYMNVAQKCGIRDFSEFEIYGRSKGRKKALNEAAKNKQDYIFVVTGGQGEPNAVLSRIANGEYEYKIDPGDEVIFSCSTIPNPSNMANRDILERKLQFYGARIFRDVHVSGHAGKEDHRDLLTMLNPEHVIPCHGGLDKLSSYAKLASERRDDKYLLGETMHILQNGQRLDLGAKA